MNSELLVTGDSPTADGFPPDHARRYNLEASPPSGAVDKPGLEGSVDRSRAFRLGRVREATGVQVNGYVRHAAVTLRHAMDRCSDHRSGLVRPLGVMHKRMVALVTFEELLLGKSATPSEASVEREDWLQQDYVESRTHRPSHDGHEHVVMLGADEAPIVEEL